MDENALILFDLLDPKHAENKTLHNLRNILTRIEDISHILIWGKAANEIKSEDNLAEEFLNISGIELPRLKLRFTPKEHEDGITRLHIADDDSWYITDRYSLDLKDEDKTILLERDAISKHFVGLPHTLLLQNQADEFQILMANHDVHRPIVRGSPFSTNLVFDRNSATWQEVMERRYFYCLFTPQKHS